MCSFKEELVVFPRPVHQGCRPFVMVLKTERKIYTSPLILHQKSLRGLQFAKHGLSFPMKNEDIFTYLLQIAI